VADSLGALVPGAAVSIKNVQTGVVTPTATNQSGLYDVPFSGAGQLYSHILEARLSRFCPRGIVLQIETIEISATLQVGASTQEIVVNAASPLVETETTEQHVSLNSQAIDSAPIVGTDWRAELTQLIPGVNTGGGAGKPPARGSESTARRDTISTICLTVRLPPLRETSTAATSSRH